MTGIKWLSSHLYDENQMRERATIQALVRRLLLRSGPRVNLITGVDDPTANLAFAITVDETVGLGKYNEGLQNGEALELIHQIIPVETANKLNKYHHLEIIDRAIIKVSRRIWDIDQRNLRLDIRIVIIREVFRRHAAKNNKDYLDIIECMKNDLPRMSPFYRLLNAVASEYADNSSSGGRIGSWKILESWLEKSPPTQFEDLCGLHGLPLPPIPKVLSDALKPLPPGKTYYS